MAKCKECGHQFDGDDSAVRTPCPKCGATNRIVADGVTFSTTLGDHAMAELARNDEVIAFRESEREGRLTWADKEDGRVTTTITGPSPQNEADSLNVCRILVNKMNLMGEAWNEPTEGKQHSDVDCVARDAKDKDRELNIQVVKAIVDPKFWKELSISRTNTKSGTADELVDVILQAIKKKSDRTSVSQRPKLVLAVDANCLPGLTFDFVVNRVREEYANHLVAMHFQSIWIVGPSVSRTQRLDIVLPTDARDK